VQVGNRYIRNTRCVCTCTYTYAHTYIYTYMKRMCMHACMCTHIQRISLLHMHIHSYVYLFSLWYSLDKRHLPRADVVEPVQERRGVGVDKVLVLILLHLRGHNARLPAALSSRRLAGAGRRRATPEGLDAEAPKDDASLPRNLHHRIVAPAV